MKYFLSLILLLHCYTSQTESTDAQEDTSHDEGVLSRVRRGGLSMLRLGRGLQMLRLGKRGMPMLRLGRSGNDNYSPEELRLLLANLLNEYRGSRQAPLPRYGKDLEFQLWLDSVLDGNDLAHERRSWGGDFEDDSGNQIAIRPAPRPGYRFKRSAPEKPKNEKTKDNEFRSVPFPRIGKESGEEESEKESDPEYRAIPLPRLGRFYEDEIDINDLADNEGGADKRAMSMLRLGRGMKMLRLGKRPFRMLRLGRSGEDSNQEEEDKRAMKMLRLGKRPFKMLRLGKRTNSDESADKRSLRMMRLGKRTSDYDKQEVERRAMKMLRLGRSQ